MIVEWEFGRRDYRKKLPRNSLALLVSGLRDAERRHMGLGLSGTAGPRLHAAALNTARGRLPMTRKPPPAPTSPSRERAAGGVARGFPDEGLPQSQ